MVGWFIENDGQGQKRDVFFDVLNSTLDGAEFLDEAVLQ